MPTATPTGTLDRPAGSSGPAAARASRRRRVGGQVAGRTLLATVAGLVLLLAFPGWSLPLLAPLGPAALALASTSGISAVIAPDGSLAAASGLFEPAVFVEEVAQRDATTVAERLGAGLEWLLSALGAGALLAVAAPALRRRVRRGTA